MKELWEVFMERHSIIHSLEEQDTSRADLQCSHSPCFKVADS